MVCQEIFLTTDCTDITVGKKRDWRSRIGTNEMRWKANKCEWAVKCFDI